MNEIILMGRITKDLELRQTQGGMAVLQFTLAVDRPVKKGAEKQTDFISCVAWGQRAEFIESYFGKGRLILITGRLRIRSYEDKEGNKRTAAEVIVNDAHFTGERRETSQDNGPGRLDEFEDAVSDNGVPF